MSTITHSLVKHTVHEVLASKLLVGDVIATRGTLETPQRLRRVDILDGKSAIVSTPKTGADVEALTFTAKQTVVVVGRVELRTTTATPKTPKPKTQRATAKNPAPVKTTKVDAVLQTTPADAKPEPRKQPTRQTPVQSTSLRSEIRSAIREAVGAVILDEVRAAITEALA